VACSPLPARAFAVAGSVAGAGALAVTSGTVSRYVAPLVLAMFAVALLAPSLTARVLGPVTALGSRLLPFRAGRESRGVAFLTGAATGLIWAPCAGPILALVVVAAAVGDLPASQLPFVLLAFAAGSAAVFAFILILGDAMRQRFQQTWARLHRRIEFVLGAAALAVALLVVTGADARLFARVPTGPTAGIERRLVARLAPHGIRATPSAVLPDLGAMPALDGGLGWINSAPVTRESLRGKVVMVEIWTFLCYNCLNALPHVKETAARYRDRGLVTIGVHTPELPRERPRENVEKAVKDLGVVFPVVLDNNFTIWKAFNNEYWPSVYVVDRKGRIRFHHDGEGSYAELDAAVATLLAEKP
jgi:cytochrome c biogenesis protein CcdA/thiol-disulfide isomerase/thioredoxin